MPAPKTSPKPKPRPWDKSKNKTAVDRGNKAASMEAMEGIPTKKYAKGGVVRGMGAAKKGGKYSRCA